MFTILVITLVASVILGWTLGGRVRLLGRIKLAWTPILYVALALGMAPLIVDKPRWLVDLAIACAYIAVAAFLIRNMTREHSIRIGLIFLLIGWMLNASVIALNGAMPLSIRAYRASGQTETPTPRQGGFFKIELADNKTRLGFLGDVIPVHPIGQVVSVGDLFLVLGAAGALVGGMRRRQLEGREEIAARS